MSAILHTVFILTELVEAGAVAVVAYCIYRAYKADGY